MSVSVLDTNLTHDVTSGSSDINVTSASATNQIISNVDNEPIDVISACIEVLVIVLFSLTTVVGAIGNLMVIIVVYLNRTMRNSTNMLIISLAVADLCFIVFCVPLTGVTMTQPEWPMGDIFCRVYNYVINVTCFAGVYTLVLMSFDRFLAVVCPIKSIELRTTNNALKAIAVLWLFILAVTSPILFETGEIDLDGIHICGNTKILNEIIMYGKYTHARLFYGCFFVFGYFLPLVLICLLYGIMLHSLRARAPPGGSKSKRSEENKKRVTRMIFIIVSVFAVCWLPAHIRFIMQFFFRYYPESTPFYIFQTLGTCLSYMNSCMNPILYAFLSENFRQSFRGILCACCPQMVTPQARGRTARTNIELDATCGVTTNPHQTQKLLPGKETTNGKASNFLQVSSSVQPTSMTSINSCTSL